jgi:hypothetical protein
MNSPEAAARIRVELGESFAQFPRENGARPSRLYHYTTGAGLLGIVESNSLWATNILYLNDSSEISYGFSRARNHLRALREKRSTEPLITFLSRAEDLLNLSVLIPGRQFYALCFCERPDLLSQWRAYADRGGGYAIGFDTEDLTTAVIKLSLSLFQVEYGTGKNWQLLVQDIDSLCCALTRCIERWPADEEMLISATLDDFKLALIFRLFWMKHPGFSEEKEWRILANFDSAHASRVCLRPSRTTLVPYVELNLSVPGGQDKLPIREVVQGPTAHPELARLAVDWLFRKHGFQAPEIRGSTIPLRD